MAGLTGRVGRLGVSLGRRGGIGAGVVFCRRLWMGRARLRTGVNVAGGGDRLVVCVGRPGSGGGGERSDAGERFGEAGLPGPAGGEVQRPAPRGLGEPPWQGEKPAADRGGGARRGV